MVHCSTLKDSCYSDCKWAIHQLGLDRWFNCRLSPLEIEYKKKKALKIKPIVFQIQGKIFDAERLINLLNCVEPDKIGVSERALVNAGMLRVEDNNENIGFLCGIRNNDISDDSIIKIENGKIVEK